jgi:hypothetical protein
MNKLIVTVIAMAALAGPAMAQNAERSTDDYLCKDVMRESGANREVAIAFVHGVFIGKSGNPKFNLDLLKKQTDAFVERCLDNPGEKAMDAMAKAKQ